MTTSLDPKVRAIAKRIITNAQAASFYFAYFDASNKFLRENHQHLHADAGDLPRLLIIGLPRLTALCLCRFWDMPGKDRHSLPALIGIAAFAQRAHLRDPLFISDCRKFMRGELNSELKRFRIVDLAHNLPIDRTVGGLKFRRLQEIIERTQTIVERLIDILDMNYTSPKQIYEFRKDDCDRFWELVRPRVVQTQQ